MSLLKRQNTRLLCRNEAGEKPQCSGRHLPRTPRPGVHGAESSAPAQTHTYTHTQMHTGIHKHTLKPPKSTLYDMYKKI